MKPVRDEAESNSLDPIFFESNFGMKKTLQGINRDNLIGL